MVVNKFDNLYIDGKWVAPSGSSTLEVTNSTTEEALGVVPAGSAEDIRSQLREGAIHAVTFTSSSTVTNFVDAIGRDVAAELLKDVAVACIGPITAETARGLGIEPTIVSDEFTIPGIVDSLVDALGSPSSPMAGEDA